MLKSQRETHFEEITPTLGKKLLNKEQAKRQQNEKQYRHIASLLFLRRLGFVSFLIFLV